MWKILTKTALLGTERQALPPHIAEQLRAYGLHADLDDATEVLEAAAILAPMRKAGFQLKQPKTSLISIANTETAQPCSLKSIRHLNMILNTRLIDCLPEFLGYLQKVDKILPPETLPDLLDNCRSSKGLWQQLRTVIGKRGEWLIGLNPQWNKLQMHPDVSNWDIAARAERVAILEHLRETEAPTAIELLQLSWEEETVKDQVAFIQTLQTNLSLQDEVFLENCLDSKRKEVRKAAANLLLHLPASSFMQRMFDRTVVCMHMKKNPSKKDKLELDFPNDLDSAAKRDGIQIADPKWQGGTFQTGQFFQMFSLIPLEKWEAHFDKSAKELLDSFIRSDWSIMLMDATINAATLHQSEKWMAVLMDFWIENHHRSRWAKTDMKPIIKVLPDAIFNKVAFKILKQDDINLFENNELAKQLFRSEKPKWSDEVTLHFVKHFRDWLMSDYASYWGGGHFKALLKNMAFCSNPQLYKRLNNAFPEGSRFWSAWEKDVRAALSILSFRKEMLGELEK